VKRKKKRTIIKKMAEPLGSIKGAPRGVGHGGYFIKNESKKTRKNPKTGNPEFWCPIDKKWLPLEEGCKVRKGNLGQDKPGQMNTGERIEKPKKGKGSYSRKSKHQKPLESTDIFTDRINQIFDSLL